MRIAFLACPETMPGSPTRRADAFEHDEQIAALRVGLAGSGVQVVDIDWHAALETLTGFPLALLGTAWDYTEEPDAFLARLTALEAAGVQVCNPLATVRWNSDKAYLRELTARGLPSIPTLWPEAPGPATSSPRSTISIVNASSSSGGSARVVSVRTVSCAATRPSQRGAWTSQR